MPQNWLERLLDTVADRGRELLKRGPGDALDQDPQSLCQTLLGDGGEALGIALSRELLRAYRKMDAEQRLAFFQMLAREFGPDREAIRSATEHWLDSGDVESFLTLAELVEPPRQELFRRLNMAPHGTADLVAMRADLLAALKHHPELKAVDADLKHLLASWFNRGFLQLRRIDWQSPAHILEKLITYESVHAIRGWEDLRRRLDEDRRCFAFFHPAMPDEPLIFVEVALVEGIAEHVQPLLDPHAPVLDPAAANTAMFYSINNTQTGLRGISFGNFLIKQVLTELRAELPRITRFATISPMPRFAQTLRSAAAGDASGLDREWLRGLLGEDADPLSEAAGISDPLQALVTLLDGDWEIHREQLAAPLERVALAYLTRHLGRGRVLDPVASFHLANGARLECIDLFADPSERGRKQAFGTMVNYLYEPEQVEANHERFVTAGSIALSKPLAKLHKRIGAQLTAA